MLKITLMIGLPGSGKSTIAEEIIKKDDDIVIISRDDIRIMMCAGYDNYKYSSIKEGLVKSMAVACMESALERGYNVIIDETNTTKKMRLYWQTMATAIAERKGFNIKFVGMWIDTPTKVCIARRMNDPKGTNDNWAAIIGNMVKLWEDPTKDEFDIFKRIGYQDD